MSFSVGKRAFGGGGGGYLFRDYALNNTNDVREG